METDRKMDEYLSVYLKLPDLPGTDPCILDNYHSRAPHRCSTTKKNFTIFFF